MTARPNCLAFVYTPAGVNILSQNGEIDEGGFDQWQPKGKWQYGDTHRRVRKDYPAGRHRNGGRFLGGHADPLVRVLSQSRTLGECGIEDGLNHIIKVIRGAEGLIVGTSVYFGTAGRRVVCLAEGRG